MLNELYIENLAVIEKAAIPFGSSFNVFTGETGAGKSILINGINAIIGKRINKDIVRAGCEKAVITALFANFSEKTKSKMEELGIDYSDGELLITREIFADGGSVARINSKTSSISAIREIGTTLIDIHGQHDNQILLYPEKQLEIIDEYADLNSVISDYQDLFKQLQDTARTLKKLSVDEVNKKDRMEKLSKIINEIDKFNIEDENEDTLLEEECRIADNNAVLIKLLTNANIALSGDDNISGACEIIDNVANEFLEHIELIPDIDDIMKRLENVKIEINDINDDLFRLHSEVDSDDERLAYIYERKDQLNDIKRKYGPSLKDVIDTYNNATGEINRIINNSEEINRLTNVKNELLLKVTEKASELSNLRKKTSSMLVRKIEDELSFLDMPNIKFKLEHTTGKLTANGMDSFQMLISANKGEEPKPIIKIASGGELSRIMLAIKNVIAEKDQIPTLIFDEIDTGVSGRAAQKIGVKLRQISKHRQVLCVTHLSQIAVMADNHFMIEKNTTGGKTITNVNQLTSEQRKYEIARILCGEHITDTALQNAEEQLLSKDKICNDILSRYNNGEN